MCIRKIVNRRFIISGIKEIGEFQFLYLRVGGDGKSLKKWLSKQVCPVCNDDSVKFPVLVLSSKAQWWFNHTIQKHQDGNRNKGYREAYKQAGMILESSKAQWWYEISRSGNELKRSMMMWSNDRRASTPTNCPMRRASSSKQASRHDIEMGS